MPQTDVRRLQFYAKWHEDASPGSVGSIEDFGIEGAVVSDTSSFDSDLNLDRILIKVRVPSAMSDEGETVIIAVMTGNEISKSIELSLIPDPDDSKYLLTEKPVLLYEDADGELDVGQVEALLPEGSALLDPPTVDTKIAAFIGSISNNPAKKAGVAAYRLHSVSPLFSQPPQVSPETLTAESSGLIETPAFDDDWSLLYTTNEDDTTPDVRMRAVDPTNKLPVPEQIRWFVNISFKAGSLTRAGKVWNVPAQWHVLNTNPVTVNFELALHKVALEFDQWVDAIGPADYQIFAQAVIKDGQNSLIVESNLVPFKVCGVNPGENQISTLVDEYFFIQPSGDHVNQAIANRLVIPMRKWYNSILKLESRTGGLFTRVAWDHFERVPETEGIDIGFRRSVRVNGVPVTWLARFGWPFCTYDNGWGIAQLTDATTLYRNISRWKNNVYKGWRILTMLKVNAAINRLENIANRALTPADDEVLFRETVKKYNGGRQYDFSNGVFVVNPSAPNPTYVQEVEAAGTAGGYLP